LPIGKHNRHPIPLTEEFPGVKIEGQGTWAGLKDVELLQTEGGSSTVSLFGVQGQREPSKKGGEPVEAMRY